MTNRYNKLFLILDDEDMQKLKEDRLVRVDGDDLDEPIIICTEKGFKNLNDFWDGAFDDIKE